MNLQLHEAQLFLHVDDMDSDLDLKLAVLTPGF